MLTRSASNDVSVRERKIFPGGRATGVRGLRDLVTVPQLQEPLVVRDRDGTVESSRTKNERTANRLTLYPYRYQWRRNRGFRRFNEPGPRAPGAPE